MSKKGKIGACVLVITALLLLAYHLFYPGIVKRSLERKSERFSSVYQAVRDIDFATGRVEQNSLILFDAKGQQLPVIQLDTSGISGNIRFRKDTANAQVYVVLGGSVDDEYGLLFAEGAVNMDGIYSLDRLSGNCFYYQTYP